MVNQVLEIFTPCSVTFFTGQRRSERRFKGHFQRPERKVRPLYKPPCEFVGVRHFRVRRIKSGPDSGSSVFSDFNCFAGTRFPYPWCFPLLRKEDDQVQLPMFPVSLPMKGTLLVASLCPLSSISPGAEATYVKANAEKQTRQAQVRSFRLHLEIYLEFSTPPGPKTNLGWPVPHGPSGLSHSSCWG